MTVFNGTTTDSSIVNDQELDRMRGEIMMTRTDPQSMIIKDVKLTIPEKEIEIVMVAPNMKMDVKEATIEKEITAEKVAAEEPIMVPTT